MAVGIIILGPSRLRFDCRKIPPLLRFLLRFVARWLVWRFPPLSFKVNLKRILMSSLGRVCWWVVSGVGCLVLVRRRDSLGKLRSHFRKSCGLRGFWRRLKGRLDFARKRSAKYQGIQSLVWNWWSAKVQLILNGSSFSTHEKFLQIFVSLFGYLAERINP